MAESRTIRDPFLNQDVQISTKLTDRLRGRYANGPTMPNGEPEFGWREFPTPPVQHEAAAEIERLRALAKWCRMRMKRDCYRDRIDAVLANPSLMDADPEMAGKLVQSANASLSNRSK